MRLFAPSPGGYWLPPLPPPTPHQNKKSPFLLPLQPVFSLNSLQTADGRELMARECKKKQTLFRLLAAAKQRERLQPMVVMAVGSLPLSHLGFILICTLWGKGSEDSGHEVAGSRQLLSKRRLSIILHPSADLQQTVGRKQPGKTSINSLDLMKPPRLTGKYGRLARCRVPAAASYFIPSALSFSFDIARALFE